MHVGIPFMASCIPNLQLLLLFVHMHVGIPISTKRLDIGEEGKVNGDHRTSDSLHVLPAQLGLSTAELPWLVGDAASQKTRFTFWLQTMERAKSFRSILVNTFPVEATAADACTVSQQRVLQVLQVGPLLPLPPKGFDDDGCITKGDDLSHDSTSKNPSMWQADETCVEWLDAQRAGSVVYVSFGSWVASIGRDAINELALGLAATGRPFLWALKDEPSWREGLPSQYAEAVAGRGKIVAWSPQEDVLRHKAVGCYLTHCGWNSTLEAIQNGVRLLCYPVSGDQFINCAYIVKVWETGIRLPSTNRNVVEDCIERIMEGEEGRRMQVNVDEMRERVVMGEARCAANRNLDSFVDEIMKNENLLARRPCPLT
jgi:UDP:flavonoid glycosyltransferase YjiC (YdhE family)